MAKPDDIFNLERRQIALEAEISKALRAYQGNDLMVADLKRRLLHLRHEVDEVFHAATTKRQFH